VRDYAIFLLDPGGHVATWNEGAERIKGYKEEEIIGKHFSTFYPRAAKESGWPDYELNLAKAGGRFEDEGWRVRKDGSLFWADVVITAVRDERGELLAFAKVTRDLTERKSAEETLRQSEERYRMLVDAVRDYAIFMLDPDGFVVTWNSGAERLKGYQAQEIIGKHFSAFYPPERAAEGFPARELEIARTEGRFEEENWLVRKDGAMFWANVVLTAVYDKNGILQGFSKVTRDVTERRKLELAAQQLTRELNALEELNAANRALAEKNQEIEAFVYGVSHDVRGPLVNLQGFNREIQRSCGQLIGAIEANPSISADLRETASRVGDDMREAAWFMETAVSHLSGIVDGLLRLSRLGRVAYQCQLANMNEIVSRVIRSVKGTIDAAGAEIVVGNLPPVWADLSAVEQIFGNLISNALSYRDPGRRCRIEIGGTVEEGGALASYYVRDNGMGIPEPALANLFTAFQRFHPQLNPGEGMGLAVVRRILERHKGKIRVESKIGEGTAFFFELPNNDRQL
jgi:PAS domain S-box-containing protein